MNRYLKKKNVVFLFAIFITLKMVLFLNTPLFGQTDTSTNILVINSKSSITKKDSTKDIYKKLENGAKKNYITKKMYGLFIRKKDLEEAGKILKTTDAIDKFKKYSGKEISKIEIVKLDAFGYSVDDSTLLPTTWVERVSNKLHINTSGYIIRNNLLFQAGGTINPVDLSESEQLIRDLSFIEDVNIQVLPLVDTNKVSIKVITKDKWSIAAGFEMSSATSGEIHLYEKNLGGLGIGLNTYLYNDSRNPNDWGRKGELIVPNILGSFVRGEFGIHRGIGYNNYYINVKRDFYASKAKNGFGFRMISGEEPYKFKTADSTRQINYYLYDYWIGRSFRVSRKSYLKAPLNLVIAIRYQNKHYFDRPSVNIDTNYLFHNKKYYLAGLSLSQQTLFKENYIYSLGSTEDVPTGFRVQVTSGYEISEFQKRVYLSSEFANALEKKWGYLFFSARAGTFFSEGGKMEQTVINLRSSYFSKLFSAGENEMRQFIKVDYTRGIGRFAGEGDTILLGGNTGIRGLSSKSMKGTSRLALSFETVEFSKLFLYGFKFAYFLYLDMGFVGTSNLLTGSNFYDGIGIGIRIKNENLVFRTFLIRLGYYPKIPANSNVLWWSINGEQKSVLETFRSKEPQIIPFE